MSVRVRVGPSLRRPTSLGALRFALFNYAFAVANGGSFVVRIEDTDTERGNLDLLNELYETLDWIGIGYHEGGARGGPYGPYQQSARLAVYAEHAGALIDNGLAYRCFCSRARLAGLRQSGSRAGYDGRCAGLDPSEGYDRAQCGESFVVRMRVPRGTGHVRTVHDEVYGDLTIALDTLDDQVLLKSDGFPTYHFSSVVDDHLMRMSHVLRADVWLVSTPKHLLLYEWFGWTPPAFAHVPAMGGDIWATTVTELRSSGVPADAVVNFVAALGWHDNRVSEVFTLSDLTKFFTLAGLNRSCGRGDRDRLAWLSGRHLHRRPAAQAVQEVVPYLIEAGLPVGGAVQRERALSLCLPHCRTYSDVVTKFGYLFAIPRLDAEARSELASDRDVLAGLFDSIPAADFSARHLAAHLRSEAVRHAISFRRMTDLVRLSVFGARSAPETFPALAFLGRDECVRRLRGALFPAEKKEADICGS